MFLRHIAVKIAEFQQLFPVIFAVVHRNPSNGFVEGFIPVGAQSRQEHFFSFFLLLEISEKLTKIDFS
jgi:hypothetical protein